MTRLFFKFRGLLMIPPVVFALTGTWGSFENDLLLWGPGTALFLAGVMLRLWAQVHLHYRLRVHMALTTTGPYRFMRNPIYVGNTMMLVSVAHMSELVWFCPVMLAYACTVYSVVVRHEEAELRKRYGAAYDAYCREVPRWWPRLGAGSPGTADAVPAWRQFLWPSILAEAHTLLLPLPFVAKELLSDIWG